MSTSSGVTSPKEIAIIPVKVLSVRIVMISNDIIVCFLPIFR